MTLAMLATMEWKSLKKLVKRVKAPVRSKFLNAAKTLQAHYKEQQEASMECDPEVLEWLHSNSLQALERAFAVQKVLYKQLPSLNDARIQKLTAGDQELKKRLQLAVTRLKTYVKDMQRWNASGREGPQPRPPQGIEVDDNASGASGARRDASILDNPAMLLAVIFIPKGLLAVSLFL